MECLKKLCRAVIEVYGRKYLGRLNQENVERLMAVGEDRNFPDMLDSLDCMYRIRKNCPTAWKGQYKGKRKEVTVILKAMSLQILAADKLTRQGATTSGIGAFVATPDIGPCSLQSPNVRRQTRVVVSCRV
ncbi:hypothetical protein G6F56_002948 [Rhizopus delemar]|nr:hypothetical protein G6F56_002948 [Rhizopus delemar]